MRRFFFLAISVLAFGVLHAQNPGDLDSEFGSNGTFITEFDDDPDAPTATFILDDGKILTVGNTWINYSSYLLVTRHLSDGSVDVTYGEGGKSCFKALQGGNNYAWDAVLLDDGSLILAGHAFVNPSCRVILAKLDANGQLDATFGNNGIAPYSDNRNFVIKACAVQQDGKIVLGGYCEDAFCALRFNADGSLDTGFASNGLFVNELGLVDSFVECMTLQDDGKIVLAGWGIITSDYNFYESVVARLDEQGNLDPTFGDNGYVVFDINEDLDTAHDVEVLADGKILINGYYHIYQEGTLRYGIYLNRRNADGSNDMGFGTNGFVLTECVSYAENYSEEMVIAEDGTIFCAGNTRADGGGKDLLVASFMENGEINTAFGTNGYVVVEFDEYQSESRSLAMQPDGKLVVTGSVFDNDGALLMLSRFHTGVVTAVEETEAEMLKAYPNPCTHIVRFDVTGRAQARVYDLMGRLVLQGQLSEEGALDVAMLSHGSYVVEMQDGAQCFKAKFVK